MLSEIIILSLLTAIFNLDNYNFFISLAGRPIFFGPILGSIFGNPEIGIKTGCILELLWVNLMPLGVKIPYTATVATSIACFTTIFFNKRMGVNIFPVIFYFAVLASFLGSLLERIRWRLNTGLVYNALNKLRHKSTLWQTNFLSIFITVILFGLFTFLFQIGLIYVLNKIFFYFPPDFFKGVEFISRYIFIFGLVLFINWIDVPKRFVLLVPAVVLGILVSILKLNIFILLALCILVSLCFMRFHK